MRFKNQFSQGIWLGLVKKGFPASLVRPTQRKLVMVLDTLSVESLRIPPGNRLEALKGKRKGQYSIRINSQWRICFRWDGEKAIEIEVVDYH